MVQMEREQAERERAKEEEERRRRREELQRKKRMLEAAFDGDIHEIDTVLQEVRPLTYMHISLKCHAVCSDCGVTLILTHTHQDSHSTYM